MRVKGDWRQYRYCSQKCRFFRQFAFIRGVNYVTKQESFKVKTTCQCNRDTDWIFFHSRSRLWVDEMTFHGLSTYLFWWNVVDHRSVLHELITCLLVAIHSLVPIGLILDGNGYSEIGKTFQHKLGRRGKLWANIMKRSITMQVGKNSSPLKSTHLAVGNSCRTTVDTTNKFLEKSSGSW